MFNVLKLRISDQNYFRCDHPNITKLFNFYELPTSYCLILEYVNGGDLFDAIRESV